MAWCGNVISWKVSPFKQTSHNMAFILEIESVFVPVRQNLPLSFIEESCSILRKWSMFAFFFQTIERLDGLQIPTNCNQCFPLLDFIVTLGTSTFNQVVNGLKVHISWF